MLASKYVHHVLSTEHLTNSCHTLHSRRVFILQKPTCSDSNRRLAAMPLIALISSLANSLLSVHNELVGLLELSVELYVSNYRCNYSSLWVKYSSYKFELDNSNLFESRVEKPHIDLMPERPATVRGDSATEHLLKIGFILLTFYTRVTLPKKKDSF